MFTNAHASMAKNHPVRATGGVPLRPVITDWYPKTTVPSGDHREHEPLQTSQKRNLSEGYGGSPAIQ